MKGSIRLDTTNLVLIKMRNTNTPNLECNTMQDSLKGILVGLAVGDALGAPHEFHNSTPLTEYTGILEIVPKYRFRFVSRDDVIGQYTDDTEMTLANIRSVITNDGFEEEEVALGYMKWANCSKAMGRNTRALFKGVKTYKGYRTRFKKIFTSQNKNEWTQSNGCLMRCSFLSFLGDDIVGRDCKLTNPSQICIQSCLVYTRLIRGVVLDPEISKKTLVKRALEGVDEKRVRNTVIRAVKGKMRDVTGRTKGWVLHALWCAIYAWIHFDSYQDGIDAVIRMGGDTDTNAAITGALIGAHLGFEKLNEEERTNLNWNIILQADFSTGDNPRPSWLLLHDTDDLVQKYENLLLEL